MTRVLVFLFFFMLGQQEQELRMLPCDKYRVQFPECEATGGEWILDDLDDSCDCQKATFADRKAADAFPKSAIRHFPENRNERYKPTFYDPLLKREVDTPRCMTCHFVTVMEVSSAQRFDEIRCQIEAGENEFPPPLPTSAEWECAFFGMVELNEYHETPLHRGRHVNRGDPKAMEIHHDADLIIANLGGTKYLWTPEVEKGRKIEAPENEVIEYLVYCRCPIEWSIR